MILQLPPTLGSLGMIKGPAISTFSQLSARPYWRLIVGDVTLSPGAVSGAATVAIDIGYGGNELGMNWPATQGVAQLPYGFLCPPGGRPNFTNTNDPNAANAIEGFEFNLLPFSRNREIGSRVKYTRRGQDIRISNLGTSGVTSDKNTTEYLTAYMVPFETTADVTHASEVDLTITIPDEKTGTSITQISVLKVAALGTNDNVRASFFFVLPPRGSWSTSTVGNAPTVASYTQIPL